MAGKPMIELMAAPQKIAENESPSGISSNKNIIEYARPEVNAMASPMIFPPPKLSTKKQTIPKKTIPQAHRSSLLARRFRKIMDNMIKKIGAVYCRTIEFAAVVILLAMAKSRFVKNTDSEPIKTQRLNFGLWCVMIINRPKMAKAMMLRPAFSATPLQGINFMHKPPVLYRRDAMQTQSIPL